MSALSITLFCGAAHVAILSPYREEKNRDFAWVKTNLPTSDTTRSASQRDEAFLLSLAAVRIRPMRTAAEVFKDAGFVFSKPAGQVSIDSPYGMVLYELASSPHVSLALETGTWDGSGSSLALAKGLNASSGMLFTIEANEQKWLEAENNLAPYPVKCLLGIGVDGTQLPASSEVEEAGGVEGAAVETWKKWLEGEKAVAQSYPVGLIKPICERYRVDLVHIDGAEFAGPAELVSVRSNCKDVRYIALDDTKVFKNKLNYASLLADPDWEVYKESQTDRHGWAVFFNRSATFS